MITKMGRVLFYYTYVYNDYHYIQLIGKTITHYLMSLQFQTAFLYFDILKDIRNEMKYINSDIFEMVLTYQFSNTEISLLKIF